MVLHRNLEVNNEDEILEDQEDDKSFKEYGECSCEIDDKGMCILV